MSYNNTEHYLGANGAFISGFNSAVGPSHIMLERKRPADAGHTNEYFLTTVCPAKFQGGIPNLDVKPSTVMHSRYKRQASPPVFDNEPLVGGLLLWRPYVRDYDRRCYQFVKSPFSGQYYIHDIINPDKPVESNYAMMRPVGSIAEIYSTTVPIGTTALNGVTTAISYDDIPPITLLLYDKQG